MEIVTRDTMTFSGVKILVSGDTGTGKSYFAQTAPNSFIIDSEAGSTYYAFREINIDGKKYDNVKYLGRSVDYKDLEEKLDSIISGELDIDTLVIDSETRFYNSLVESCTRVRERRAKLDGKAYDARAMWGDVKRIHNKLQLAKITASMKGCRIISIAQAQSQTVDNPETNEKEVVWKLDTHRTMGFDYDIHIKMDVKKDPKTGDYVHFATVLKDRTGAYQYGDVIPNPTYDNWAKYVENKDGMSISKANFVEDNKANAEYVESDVEKTETLSKELVEALKEVPKEKREEAQSKLKELKIDIRRMTESTSDTLAEAVEAIKSL